MPACNKDAGCVGGVELLGDLMQIAIIVASTGQSTVQYPHGSVEFSVVGEAAIIFISESSKAETGALKPGDAAN